jgi:hypothetical protein
MALQTAPTQHGSPRRPQGRQVPLMHACPASHRAPAQHGSFIKPQPWHRLLEEHVWVMSRHSIEGQQGMPR